MPSILPISTTTRSPILEKVSNLPKVTQQVKSRARNQNSLMPETVSPSFVLLHHHPAGGLGLESSAECRSSTSNFRAHPEPAHAYHNCLPGPSCQELTSGPPRCLLPPPTVSSRHRGSPLVQIKTILGHLSGLPSHLVYLIT